MKPALAPLATALADVPPWLSPHALLAKRVLHTANSHSVAVALNAASCDTSAPVRFIDHSALPLGESYESFIARTASVPTRDNLHDLFNGLVWLAYPQTKRRLNTLQAEQITLHGSSGPRGPLRDALTLFDENAALLQAPDSLVKALRERAWNSLFISQRAQWQSARLVIFGHALLEKLMQPRKGITAHVWVTDDLTDQEVASSLTTERLGAKTFLPLPVLGVPGWWSANTDPNFYDDADVFRPISPDRPAR